MRGVRHLALLTVLVTAVAAAITASFPHPHNSDATHWQPAALALASSNMERIPAALSVFDGRVQRTSDTPWYLLHGLLGWGQDREILAADETPVRCVRWLLEEASWRNECYGIAIVERDVDRYRFTPAFTPLQTRVFEGHFGQTLYSLWCAGADPDIVTVRVPLVGERISLREFVRTLQSDCHEFSDLSWALPVIAAWSDDDRWVNRFGTVRSMDDLLRQHLASERQSRACFGTHWTMALALCVRMFPQRFSGDVLGEARSRLERALQDARASQEPSGRFPLPPSDAQPRIGDDAAQDVMAITFQAHTLEWLSVAVSDETLLREEWLHKGFVHLLDSLASKHSRLLYDVHAHAARALRLYENRIMRYTAN